MTIKIIHNPAWKDTPIRFKGPSPSSCCHWPTVLVQSMSGGFVRQNCTKCGYGTRLVREYDFLYRLDCVVVCPYCRHAMYREVLWDKNYGFVCHDCRIGLWLAAIVPDWSDVVPRIPSAAAVLRGI